MRSSVLLAAEGPGFDPWACQVEALQHGFNGRVVERRQHGVPASLAGVQRFYWASNHVELASGAPEEVLLEMLRRFGEAYPHLTTLANAKISAQIVVHLLPSDQWRGVFLSAELVRALAFVGADLDIDIEHDLRD